MGGGEAGAFEAVSACGASAPSGNDGEEKAGLVLRAPVQGASAFRAFLVGGRELPGERVAWPQPAASDDQPQGLPRPEQGGRRAEGDVSLDDLSRRQRLTVAEGGYRVERPGALLVEGAQRGFQPAGCDAVAAEAVGTLEGDVGGPAPFLHTGEQVNVVGATGFHPQPQGHRPGYLGVGCGGPFPARAPRAHAKGDMPGR